MNYNCFLKYSDVGVPGHVHVYMTKQMNYA